MEQNEIIVTLDSSTLSFNTRDRIEGVLYKLYHEKIDPMISQYERALKLDVKAVGSIKLASLKVILSTSNETVDLTPFAADFQNKITEYREAHNYDDPGLIIYNISETFRTSGMEILKQVFESEKYGLNTFDLNDCIKKFELQYHKECYQKHYVGTKSFEEFLKEEAWGNYDYENINELMLTKFQDELFWDLFNQEMGRFGDLSSNKGEEIIAEVQKEILWRQEYLNNPKNSNFVLNLKVLCEKSILNIISNTLLLLELDLNISHCNWETYQSCLGKIKLLQNNSSSLSDKKKIIISALETFPLEKSLYRHILKVFGDADGNITSLANFFELDINLFKSELLEEYIATLPPINMNFENEISERLQEIFRQKQFLGCSFSISKEEELQRRLQELDILQRTVRGQLYETREEAERVRNDYSLLVSRIQNIDFDSYNLLDQNDIEKIKSDLFSSTFKSDAFKNNPDYVLDELTPVLKRYIQIQTWREQLQKSIEPWIMVEEIVRKSDIIPEIKDKLKYWNFTGLKKYYPSLLKFERPVLFLKISLFGWSKYFVLTNKRGLLISENEQRSIAINNKTDIRYINGQLSFRNEEKNNSLVIPINYPENKAEQFTDVLKLIALTLCNRQEVLFEIPENFYPDKNSTHSAGAVFTNRIKGIFKSLNGFLGDSDDSTPSVRYCPQCGAIVKEKDKFCTTCGNHLH